jgi:hypothetical protein
VPVIFGVSPSQGAQRPFSIVITAAQATVKVGSEVRVDVQLKNTSDVDIVFGDLSRSIYDMDVRNSKGEQAPETERMRKIHTPEQTGARFEGSIISDKLEPGNTVEEYISVDKYYDMTKPGKYTIQFQRTDRLTKKTVKSNTITITVMP